MAPDDTPDGRQRRRGWLVGLIVVLALIAVGGVVAAIVSDDGDGDVAGQVRSTADEGIDAATSAGDDALDTVTGEAPGAADAGVDAVTNGADQARDTITEGADDLTDGNDDGTSGTTPQAVQDDPLVQRLGKGRDLPFTAGPWTREQYRDRVFSRLSEATRERAEKVDLGKGFGIRIR